LKGKNGIQNEAGNKPIQNKWIINLLKGREDAREGTKEVVENL